MGDDVVGDDSLVTNELSSILTRMSGLLVSQETVRTVLDLVVSLAMETHPATVGAGVTLLRGHDKTTTASTGADVERADALQYELDEGPCLTAARQRVVVRIDEMGTDERWPRWAPAAVALGMRSSLSAPMVAGGESLGAIKLYSATPAAYSELDEQVLRLFAAQAAVLIANVQSYEDSRRLADELREALRSRDLIGQAKGVVMAQQGIDEDAAFAVLVRVSQSSHEKLRDLASRVIATVTSKDR